MLGEHDCSNCKMPPTCLNCGCLVGDAERHAAKCRSKAQVLIPGQCPEYTLQKNAKGRLASLPCSIDGDPHEDHEVDFEGYRFRWRTKERVSA